MMFSNQREHTTKPRQLPIGHSWFNYKERVEKDLKKLTKQTGITDWQSTDGQLVLADLQMRDLRDNVSLEQQADW